MNAQKWDSLWLGALIGLILPALFCLAYAHTIGLQHMWQDGMYEALKPVIGRMLLLATFVNMAVMFVLYELNVWKLATGVLIAIVPYMAAGIILLG
ncbi:MAG: hypothetical protein J5823_03480 [Paludibacteraceae bacterium]|nr:hypothetical protein [Paludibacteraceae bacterium]